MCLSSVTAGSKPFDKIPLYLVAKPFRIHIFSVSSVQVYQLLSKLRATDTPPSEHFLAQQHTITIKHAAPLHLAPRHPRASRIKYLPAAERRGRCTTRWSLRARRIQTRGVDDRRTVCVSAILSGYVDHRDSECPRYGAYRCQRCRSYR